VKEKGVGLFAVGTLKLMLSKGTGSHWSQLEALHRDLCNERERRKEGGSRGQRKGLKFASLSTIGHSKGRRRLLQGVWGVEGGAQTTSNKNDGSRDTRLANI